MDLDDIANASREKGHSPGPWQRTGALHFARCTKCLALVWLEEALSKFGGVALEHACDPKAVDKATEFRPAAMSDGHRALISGQWKHPAVKVRKA